MSRKPTARNSPGRSPQNDRTASRPAPPELTVTTRKIAARVKVTTTVCDTGGRPDCAPGVVKESRSTDSAPLREHPSGAVSLRDCAKKTIDPQFNCAYAGTTTGNAVVQSTLPCERPWMM